MKYQFKQVGMEYFDRAVKLCNTWWQDSLWFKLYQMPYAPDRATFQAMADAGVLLFIAGEMDGDLVAFYAAALAPYHYNRDALMANELVWTVRPDMQRKGVADQLLAFVEKTLKDKGVHYAFLHVPENMQAVGLHIEGLGYKLTDYVYSKGLK